VGSRTSRGVNTILDVPRPVQVRHEGRWHAGDLTAVCAAITASAPSRIEPRLCLSDGGWQRYFLLYLLLPRTLVATPLPEGVRFP